MAEFCLECFKKDIDETAKDSDIILSDHVEFCEGCAELKRIVVEIKSN